jgi:hypothetical protein
LDFLSADPLGYQFIAGFLGWRIDQVQLVIMPEDELPRYFYHEAAARQNFQILRNGRECGPGIILTKTLTVYVLAIFKELWSSGTTEKPFLVKVWKPWHDVVLFRQTIYIILIQIIENGSERLIFAVGAAPVNTGDDSDGNPLISTVSTLADMTMAAVNHLDGNPKGFYLHVGGV